MADLNSWQAFLNQIEQLKHFGFGAYVLPGVHDRWWARNRFLMDVRRVTPEALTDLRSIAPTFHQYSRMCPLDHVPRWREIHGAVRDSTGEQRQTALILTDQVESWAARYNLVDEWLLDVSVRTLWAWRKHPDLAEELLWAYPFDKNSGIFPGLPAVPAPPTLPPYDPFHETADHYARCVSNIVREYVSDVEKCFEQAGWVRATTKRNPIHFEWLVRFQVQGWPPAKIADEYREDKSLRNTVRDALKATAGLVGLTLRRQAPGRPRTKMA